jgi:solute carrier family 25 thiamine pyrophosphate transporter 19
MMQFAKRMVSTYGFKGFFAGCNPALIQIVPYMGLNFALYDTFLRLQTDEKNGKVANAGLSGTIAGGVSKAMVYPLDTVKKRIQAQTFSAIVRQQEGEFQRQYKGMIDCITQIGRTEGLVGFYRGMVPSVMKNAAATGLTFAFFTRTKSMLEAIYDAKRVDEKEASTS